APVVSCASYPCATPPSPSWCASHSTDSSAKRREMARYALAGALLLQVGSRPEAASASKSAIVPPMGRRAPADLDAMGLFIRIVDAGFDLAIRMGSLDESDLVSRRLARIERKVVASPAYVAARGTPKTIADLARHLPLVSDPLLDTWKFDGKEGPLDVRLKW